MYCASRVIVLLSIQWLKNLNLTLSPYYISGFHILPYFDIVNVCLTAYIGQTKSLLVDMLNKVIIFVSSVGKRMKQYFTK